MRALIIPAVVMLLSGAAGLSCAAESAEEKAKKAAAVPATRSEIDRLLSPVALYPDQLLAHILLCAATPAKVSELAEWLAANQALTDGDLQQAALRAGFEPSFAALAPFPQVVNAMAAKLDWTTRIGQAFAADPKAVFAGIQRLRAQAHEAGALKFTPQQQRGRETIARGRTSCQRPSELPAPRLDV